MATLPLLGFLAVPLIEIATLIEVGHWLGVWKTLTLLLASAAIGVILVRSQGLAVLYRMQRSLSRGELPLVEAADGFFLMVAGALLILPGFVSDVFGFLLLIPPIRRYLGRAFRHHVRMPEGAVIEGVFHDVSPDDPHHGKIDILPPPGTSSP